MEYCSGASPMKKEKRCRMKCTAVYAGPISQGQNSMTRLLLANYGSELNGTRQQMRRMLQKCELHTPWAKTVTPNRPLLAFRYVGYQCNRTHHPALQPGSPIHTGRYQLF